MAKDERCAASQAAAEASALRLILAELAGDEHARCAELAELKVDNHVAGVIGYAIGGMAHLLKENFGADAAIALVAADLAARLEPTVFPGGPVNADFS